MSNTSRRLFKNQLHIKGEKCEFNVHKVAFLGYIIGPGGVLMDQSKVTAVTN